MVRELKHHEKKLLKKVNFLKWKNENNQRELQVRRRPRGWPALPGLIRAAQRVG
jgi:hypothetical protein